MTSRDRAASVLFGVFVVTPSLIFLGFPVLLILTIVTVGLAFLHPIVAMVLPVVLGVGIGSHRTLEASGGLAARLRWGAGVLALLTAAACVFLIDELSESCLGECAFSHDKGVWLLLAPLLTLAALATATVVSGSKRIAWVFVATVASTLALGGWILVVLLLYALGLELGVT